MSPRARTHNGAASTKASTRRDELLGIAAELFARNGYSQTTVRDIADEAGILSGSLYHHFDSKETMLREILRSFMGDLLASCTQIVAKGAAAGATLDELVRTAFATIHEQPAAVALYQNESGTVANLEGFDFVARTSREIEKVWVGVLQAGCDSGEFRNDLDVRVTHRFIRETVWSSVRWYNPRGRLKHDALASHFLSMLHGGILA